MLNKLQALISRYAMVQPGDRVVCAVSGGADSVALLFAVYLLKEKLGITVEAAHFNHNLRGNESKRDEEYVRSLCDRLDIPLHVGSGYVTAGKKGLEAAAREARYEFLYSLNGKIATAHTANDNAETVLMHLVRGSGLKGLGGIAPVSDRLIRPMLDITRQDVLAFLDEYNLTYVEDSSNKTDQFLRNRLRHSVMPALETENPCFAENVSAMAMRLRNDEVVLEQQAREQATVDVFTMRQMPEGIRNRVIANFLRNAGVKEPEAEHVAAVQRLVDSDKPSAKAYMRDGIVVARCYEKLEVQKEAQPLQTHTLNCPGTLELKDSGLRVVCEFAAQYVDTTDAFTVVPEGSIVVRCRKAGDNIRLHGGTKDLKKLFIDKKIPASQRLQIPVICDERGVLGVFGFGVNRERLANEAQAVLIRFEKIV